MLLLTRRIISNRWLRGFADKKPLTSSAATLIGPFLPLPTPTLMITLSTTLMTTLATTPPTTPTPPNHSTITIRLSNKFSTSTNQSPSSCNRFQHIRSPKAMTLASFYQPSRHSSGPMPASFSHSPSTASISMVESAHISQPSSKPTLKQPRMLYVQHHQHVAQVTTLETLRG